jgi:hypothetical protein
MPKVMIEVDIPDGWKIPQSEDVKRLVDPDWMASWWHIDDVKESFNSEEDHEELNLTDDEAREVLRLADKYHDCEQGINWEVLYSWAEDVINKRKEVA